MTTPRAITECDQCGQADDHPKLHYGVSTWHHDCVPAKVRAELLGGVHAVEGALASIFEKADAGVRGPDLLAHIQSIHQEAPADAPVDAAPAPAEGN